MIKAVFYKKNGGLSGFSLSGHAGWGESGSDVVCASVSSAAELVCNTVTDFFNDEAEVSVLENKLALKSAAMMFYVMPLFIIIHYITFFCF